MNACVEWLVVFSVLIDSCIAQYFYTINKLNISFRVSVSISSPDAWFSGWLFGGGGSGIFCMQF